MTTDATRARPVGNQPTSSPPETITKWGPILLIEAELNHVAAAGSKPGCATGTTGDTPPHRPK